MSDPDPRTTAGLEPGGGVRPGETPPGESSTSEAQPEQPDSGRAWGPVPLALIVALTLLLAVLFVVMGIVVIID